MVDPIRTQRNLLISFIATTLIHFILLFCSSQMFLWNRENDAEFASSKKMIVEFKFIGVEKEKTENKMIAQSRKASKKNRNTLSPVPRVKVRTLRFQGQKTFQRSLPSHLQNSSISESDASFNLEIPQGVPEDQMTDLEHQLYSFIVRLNTQYITTLIDHYLEQQRLNPRYRIPINRDQDSILLRTTYDRNGEIVRIRTLKASRYDKHADFFLNAVRKIETIPNPPELILDERNEFHVTYHLKLNPTYRR